MPTRNDTDGLSLFRELFTTPTEVISSGKNPSGYYVIKIPVKDILELGLNIIPDPQDDQPNGHSLIPDLNYNLSKQIKKTWQTKLAALANKDFPDNLVYDPNI